jgi:hypothetical protein
MNESVIHINVILYQEIYLSLLESSWHNEHSLTAYKKDLDIYSKNSFSI